MKLRYLLMAAVIAGVWHLAGASDDAQQAYREYHQAIIDADLETFKQYLPDAQLKDWSGDDAVQKLAARRGSVPADVEVTGAVAAGKKIRLLTKGGRANGTVELINEDGNWKVLSEQWTGAITALPDKPSAPKSPPDKVTPPATGEKMSDEKLPLVPVSIPGKIAFCSNRNYGTRTDYELYTINADGTNLKQLTKMKGVMSGINWSPDGQKIAFTCSPSGDDSEYELYVINSDGTNLIRLTDNKCVDAGPVWSPDGKTIAFKSMVSKGAGSTSEIFLVTTGLTELVQLTKTAAVSASKLAWSPDSLFIAFVSCKSKDRPNIYIADINTGINWQLTGGLSDDSPVWLRDGKKILFRSLLYYDRYKGWDTGLVIINKDGTGNKIFVDGNVLEFPPQWSPDGSRILYQAYGQPSGSYDLCIYNVDAFEIQRLINTKQKEIDPSWSPDGAWICVLIASELYVIKTDDSGVKYKIYSDRCSIDGAVWSPTK